MIILITDQPGTNSYLTSLIEAYRNTGATIICGYHNFLYSNLIPDILHIQWPEKLYSWYPFSSRSSEHKLNLIEDRLKWYKANNVFIIHTIHNIRPHSPGNQVFEKSIFELIIRYSDVLSHHCSKSIELMKGIYPEVLKKKNIINHHGDYLIDYVEASKIESRKLLGIPKDKFVILNFGSQQKYKDEKFISTVFRKLNLKGKYLILAGNNRSSGFSVVKKVFISSKVFFINKNPFSQKKYFLKTIDPSMLPYFFSASDLILLAHQNSLNSGLLSLAATYSRPVVFPDIGCFSEEMEYWIFEKYRPGNLNEAHDAIIRLAERLPNIHITNKKWLEVHSWEEHLRIIIQAYYQFKADKEYA